MTDDGANPTVSLKDRASFIVAAFASKHGISEVVVASAGNAGSSGRCRCSCRAEGKALFTKNRSSGKNDSGTAVRSRLGAGGKNYDQAFSLSLEYSNRHGGMNRNTAYKRMTIEGKKTDAF